MTNVFLIIKRGNQIGNQIPSHAQIGQPSRAFECVRLNVCIKFESKFNVFYCLRFKNVLFKKASNKLLLKCKVVGLDIPKNISEEFSSTGEQSSEIEFIEINKERNLFMVTFYSILSEKDFLFRDLPNLNYAGIRFNSN